MLLQSEFAFIRFFWHANYMSEICNGISEANNGKAAGHAAGLKAYCAGTEQAVVSGK